MFPRAVCTRSSQPGSAVVSDAERLPRLEGLLIIAGDERHPATPEHLPGPVHPTGERSGFFVDAHQQAVWQGLLEPRRPLRTEGFVVRDDADPLDQSEARFDDACGGIEEMIAEHHGAGAAAGNHGPGPVGRQDRRPSEAAPETFRQVAGKPA